MLPTSNLDTPSDQNVLNAYESLNRLYTNLGPYGLTLLRLISLVLLYIYCIVQFPAWSLNVYAQNEHKSFAFLASIAHFTLLVWTALLFTYLLTWGSVKHDANGKRAAAGWVITLSPSIHMCLAFLSFAITNVTIFANVGFEMTMRYMIDQSDDIKKSHADASFRFLVLKMNTFLCFAVVAYSAYRIIKDMEFMRKKKIAVVDENSSVVASKYWPLVSREPEECTICTSRPANRHLICGHVICCCCLSSISRSKCCVTCPFCRCEIINARKLLVSTDGNTTHLQDCECKMTMEDNMKNEIEDDHQPDGASAVLLPIPDVPSMSI